MRCVALIVLVQSLGCSADFDVPEIAGDLVPGVELCDYGAGPLLQLRFEERNCGPLLGRDESKPGTGVDFCSVAINLGGVYPGLVAHITCNQDVTECTGVAEAPDGCEWGVGWELPEVQP